MENTTLNIKIKPELARSLKALSKKNAVSVGELVKKALVSCYQIDLIGIDSRRRHAIEAYQGGYISLGKLSEELGMSLLDTRIWLKDHNIPQNNSFLENDIENA